MNFIYARNVNEAYVYGMQKMEDIGVLQESRNGPVYVLEDPVVTTFQRPNERVLFNEVRDANPFFHFMESLWMLGGRDDVEFVHFFNNNIVQYSDDGKKFHGAYGHRWRKHFAYDQLTHIIEAFRKDPTDRRQVLSMWDGYIDPNKALKGGKDVPCNLMVLFKVVSERLDMTVFNRSNDIIWGAYGANCVHMSFLQEYMATMIGRKVGGYHQISNNFHAYVNIFEEKIKGLQPAPYDPYQRNEVFPEPLMDDPRTFDADLVSFLKQGFSSERGIPVYSNKFFSGTAQPLLEAWIQWKKKNKEQSMREIQKVTATDWRRAGKEWLIRRKW